MRKLQIILSIICLISVQRASNSVQKNVPLKQDISTIETYRCNMDKLLDYMKGDSLLHTTINDKKLIPYKHKERYRLIWGVFWHYLNKIDRIKNKYKDFYSIEKDEINPDMFKTYYSAQLTYQCYGIELLNITQKYKDFDVILDEKHKSLHYPDNSYSIFKNNILKFSSTISISINKNTYKDLAQKDATIDKYIQSDLNYMSSSNYKSTVKLAVKNFFHKIDKDWSATLYPTQKKVAKFVGNVKIWRKNEVFITDQQIEEIDELLEPGDILLQRREWVLTNLFIPGYWTHSALYIGTPEERSDYFSKDSLLVNWLSHKNAENFDSLLYNTYSSVYNLSTIQHHNSMPTILESIEEGVVFNTLRQSANCDGVVIIRPKLSKTAKAQAIYNAFKYAGCPYDYNFNFLTDSTMVCTELIYKSFELNENGEGLSFNIKNMGNRKYITANDIAREFDNEYDTFDNQFDFVVFYDSSEKQHKAILSNIENFRNSWKRSKFYFLYDKLLSSG